MRLIKIKNDSKEVKTLRILETNEDINLKEGYSIQIFSKEQNEAIKNAIETKECDHEVQEWNNVLGGFVFVLFKYSDRILTEHTDITPDDIVKLFYLATYVDYYGYIYYDDSYVNRKMLRKLLDLSRTQFDLFFNKMKDNNILIIDISENIKINREYFLKGEIDKEVKSNFDYTRIYTKTIQYLFEHVPQRKHKKLGMYFKLIPYIHRQYNTLCWNPDSNVSNMQLMKLRDIKDILNYHQNSVKPFIRELLETRLENGQAILAFFVDNINFWESTIIVNPRVFYGGNFKLDNGKNTILDCFKLRTK